MNNINIQVDVNGLLMEAYGCHLYLGFGEYIMLYMAESLRPYNSRTLMRH